MMLRLPAIVSLLMASSAPADPTPAWADPKLSRAERVEECGGCHPDAYDDWKKGPHARSWVRWDMQRKKVEDESWPGYEHIAYSRQCVREAGDTCLRCHAPTAVFDEAVPVTWRSANPPPMRELVPRAEDRATGVDCLTCHVRGDQVITGASFVRTTTNAQSGGACDPVASNMFSSVYQCRPCHESVAEYGAYVAGAGGAVKVKTCDDCHREHDASGKRTHYYFWGHDPADKKRPAQLETFTHVELEVTTTGGFFGWFGKSVLNVRLNNDFQGHGFFPNGPPTQYIVSLELIGDDGKSFNVGKIFITSAFELERATAQMAKRRPDPKTRPLVVSIGAMQDWKRTFELPKSSPTSGTISLEVYEKENFELPDSFAELIYERSEAFDIR